MSRDIWTLSNSALEKFKSVPWEPPQHRVGQLDVTIINLLCLRVHILHRFSRHCDRLLTPVSYAMNTQFKAPKALVPWRHCKRQGLPLAGALCALRSVFICIYVYLAAATYHSDFGIPAESRDCEAVSQINPPTHLGMGPPRKCHLRINLKWNQFLDLWVVSCDLWLVTCSLWHALHDLIELPRSAVFISI